MRLATITAVFASVVFASAAASAAPYGMAGCGLGSIVMGSDGNQILAMTTNGVAGSQFFGIILGTSNCSGGGDASAALNQDAFVRTNYANLMNDAARGEGAYLSAYATVLGCDASVHTELFSLTQQNHESIFPADATPDSSLNVTKDLMRQNTKLASSCSAI